MMQWAGEREPLHVQPEKEGGRRTQVALPELLMKDLISASVWGTGQGPEERLRLE